MLTFSFTARFCKSFFSIKNALSDLEDENTYMMVIIMSDDMYVKN